MSNLIHSIQDRLRRVAKESGKDFQLILTRYFQERLLFRLSISEHRDNFCLKGGALLYALEREASRPTLDIDLLAMKSRLDKELFLQIFKEICSISYPEDGVQVDLSSITVVEIMEQRRYAGLKIKIPISLGKMRQPLSVDIGFGDVPVPDPGWMVYPTQLDMQAPEIKVYSTEAIIAEKFEAMIDLAESNSRMKDFYDVWKLLSKGEFEKDMLQKAISQTLRNRRTALTPNHPIFQTYFVEDVGRNKLWEGFLRRSKLNHAPSFREVMAEIQLHLQEVYKAYLDRNK
jgi:predicted nucleotidyltransferase component of viral defense system